jgi:hypothetical protein
LELLFDTNEESFQNLPRILLAIRDLNLISIVIWDHKMVDDNKVTFERAFFAFDASIDGFQYCHPLISINDTHLYGKYKAKLLVVAAYNMHNRVYPLRFDIIKEETNNNWSWFLDLLHQYVIGYYTRLCIISGRNVAITAFIAHIFPERIGYHQYCS